MAVNSSSSSSQSLQSRNRGWTVKLSKLPSLKPSMRRRRAKSRLNWLPIDLSSDESTLKQLSPVRSPDALPNYMMSMCSSDANKENSQGGSESEGNSVVISSTCESTVSTPSCKDEDQGMKAGPKIKKTLNKSRSNKLSNFGSLRSSRRREKSRFDKPFIILQDDAVMPQQPSSVQASDSSPNYLKATHCSSGKKTHFQESPLTSEYSFDSSSHYSQSASSSQKSMQRTSSLRTVRFLKNKTSFKSKRPSMKKCPEVSQDLSVDRGIFSSTLKDLKFPEHVELHPGQHVSDRISVTKVCPYHHCSLNGHCHNPVLPPKRFLSRRRPSLKSHKSMKPKGHSTFGTEGSGDRKKEVKINQILPNVDAAVHEGANASAALSRAEDDKGLDFVIETYPQQRAQHFGSPTEENEDADLLETLFGESSYPENSLQEHLKQVRDYPEEEQDIRDTNYELKETNSECCCIKTELDKSISMSAAVDSKCEEDAASNLDNENDDSILKGANADFCSSVLSLKPDDQVSTCSEEVQKSTLELGKDEASNIVNNSIPNNFGESAEDIGEISSASIGQPFQEPSADTERINGNSESARENVERFSPVRESEPDETAHEAYKNQFNKEKHISMWHLIHQHMESGLATESGSQPPQGVDEEKRTCDANTLPSSASSGSCLELHDSNMGMQKHDSVSQEIELRKIYAIKLVRKAIEKILLPEVQDQESDDQSITSDDIRDQQLLENYGEDSARDSSRECSYDKEGDNISVDSKELSFMAGNISGPEEEKAATKVGKKIGKQALKNWSNLKKMILLKRFVNELEKVRKFNPRKPRYLPVEHDAEVETNGLRHQMTAERKSAEEWMLDYALRQVVSQLAPTQKRKVALLVKAFESVVPTKEDQHIHITFSKLKDNSQEDCRSRSKLDESASEVTDTDQKAENEVHEDTVSSSNFKLLDGASNLSRKSKELDGSSGIISELSHIIRRSSPGGNGESTETKNIIPSASECYALEKITASREENNAESKPELVDLRGIQEDGTSLNSECPQGDFELSGKNMDLESLCGDSSYRNKGSNPNRNEESAATEDIVSSASECDAMKQLTAAREEKNRESKAKDIVIRGSSTPVGFESDGKSNGAYKPQLDKQNNIRMWHMIYQHVVSNIADKVGNKLLLDRADEEEQVEDANTSSDSKTSGSCHHFSKTDHDASKENYDASQERTEFSRSDAVKLVQEAVDEILLPDTQDDSSDAQSTSDIVLDHELIEKNCGDGGEKSSLNSAKDISKEYEKNEVQGEILLDQEENDPAVENVTSPEKKTVESVVRNKFDQQKSKNWSKMKKLILLKRSIKALEKARKLDAKPSQHLPLTPAPEAEKVDLRNQMTDERKKAEQWMLDYAVQHIVTKLTPARKRNVAMLVEAFEAVVPMPET